MTPRQETVLFVMRVIFLVALVALVSTVPVWWRKVFPVSVASCEVCEAKCKPFVVSACQVLYDVQCYCDPSRRQPVALEKP